MLSTIGVILLLQNTCLVFDSCLSCFRGTRSVICPISAHRLTFSRLIAHLLECCAALGIGTCRLFLQRIGGPWDIKPRPPKLAVCHSKYWYLSYVRPETYRDLPGEPMAILAFSIKACRCQRSRKPDLTSSTIILSQTQHRNMWISKFTPFILALATVSYCQYTGRCSTSACGAEGKPCPRGYLCVPYPNFNPADRKGCTCSHG